MMPDRRDRIVFGKRIAPEVGGRWDRGTQIPDRAMARHGRGMANMKGAGRNADVAKEA